jgi:opacity protein-like surface antigen
MQLRSHMETHADPKGGDPMTKPKRSRWNPLLLLFVSGLFASTAAAQRVELFGGYQFTHLRPAFNASGWNASLTGNFKHVLGITGDFSGAYKQNVHVHTYTVGPVLTARLPVVQPFVHALFGGITASSSGGSNSGFAMLVGGGIDVGMRKGIGFRIVQADWLSTRFAGNTNNNNFRASTGIVLKF